MNLFIFTLKINKEYKHIKLKGVNILNFDTNIGGCIKMRGVFVHPQIHIACLN